MFDQFDILSVESYHMHIEKETNTFFIFADESSFLPVACNLFNPTPDVYFDRLLVYRLRASTW